MATKMEPNYHGEETPILNAAAVEVPIDYDQAQFVAIDEPYDQETTPLVQQNYHQDHSIDKEEQEQCPFRDWAFGLLFWLHLTAIVYTGVTVSPLGYEALNNNFPNWEEEMSKADDVTSDDIEKFKHFVSDATDYIQLFPMRIFVCVLLPVTTLGFIYAFLISVCIVKPCSLLVVKSSLLLTVVFTSLAMIALFISSPGVATLILAMFLVGASICFVRLLWPMVPFAAINLEVALQGITDNLGIYFVALFFSDLGCAWVAYWLYVFMGFLFYEGDQCDPSFDGPKSQQHDSGVDCDSDGWIFVLLLISLYWTCSVILNTVQVTIAGVMATWCFDTKEARGCCSSAIWDSLVRSITYSFGSICLGSFFQGLIAVIRCLIRDARSRHGNDGCDGGLCLCITECLATVLEDVLEVFNRWAYVFVGVYGYPYLQSGRRVMELFKAKGWIAITTDNLAGYVLGFTTFMVGILTGISAFVVERLISTMHPESDYESYVFGPLPGYKGTVFIIGFLIGCVTCDVMMNVVKGATNTLIVCWADAPLQFEENHPETAKRIAEAWSKSYPDAVPNLSTGPTAVAIY